MCVPGVDHFIKRSFETSVLVISQKPRQRIEGLYRDRCSCHCTLCGMLSSIAIGVGVGNVQSCYGTLLLHTIWSLLVQQLQ